MFRKTLIALGFRIIQSYLIEKITYEPLRRYFEAQVNPAKQVADILTDSNPEDNAQLEAWWKENQLGIATDGIDLAKSIIAAKVKDEKLRAIILELLDNVDEEIGNLA